MSRSTFVPFIVVRRVGDNTEIHPVGVHGYEVDDLIDRIAEILSDAYGSGLLSISAETASPETVELVRLGAHGNGLRIECERDTQRVADVLASALDSRDVMIAR